MTLVLPSVIDIVDLVDEAQERDQNVDVEADAERLLQAHPEADKNKAEIAAMLRQQQERVGLSTRGKGHTPVVLGRHRAWGRGVRTWCS